MRSNNQLPEGEQKNIERLANRTRKPYKKPWLKKLGNLHSLTLGGSPGIQDSGAQFTRKPPADLPDFPDW